MTTHRAVRIVDMSRRTAEARRLRSLYLAELVRSLRHRLISLARKLGRRSRWQQWSAVTVAARPLDQVR